MPFNPNSFNYRNVFKDDAILSSIAGGWASYVSNKIGVEPAFASAGTGVLLDGYAWGHADITTEDPVIVAKLAKRTPGLFTARDTLHDPPDVPDLTAFDTNIFEYNPIDPRDVLWEQDGPWAWAKSDMFMDPVPTWQSTRGTAIMGVKDVEPGQEARLYLVAAGGGPMPELREGARFGSSPNHFWTDGRIVAGPLVAYGGDGPVYLRYDIDTHRGTLKQSKAHSENGTPFYQRRSNLPSAWHDVPVWPVWEIVNVAKGAGYDDGIDTLPVFPPPGTAMTVNLPHDVDVAGLYTWTVDSAGPSFANIVGRYRNEEGILSETGYYYQAIGGGGFTPLVSVGDVVRPGDAIAVITSLGGNPRSRRDPVTAGKVELNLLVWRNIGGALATGDAVHGTLPHRQPVVAPPQSPETVQVPPLTAVAPGGAGIGVIAIDPYGVPLGPVGNRGVLPV